MVSAVLNYLYASKTYFKVFICCIKVHLSEKFLCISSLLAMYVVCLDSTVANFFKAFSDAFPPILYLPSSI